MRFLIFIIAFVVCACEQEVDLSIDFGKSKTVLNCIMIPDSNIVLSLTKSATVKDTAKFGIVDDACVLLFENEHFLDTLKFYSHGYYYSKHKVKAGNQYTLKAILNDSTTIEASDSIPEYPRVDSFLLLNNTKGLIQLKLVLIDQQEYESFFQIELFEIRENNKEYRTSFRIFETYRYLNLLDSSVLMRDYEFIDNRTELNMYCDVPKAKRLRMKVSKLSKSFFSYSVFATQNYIANQGSDYSRVPNYSNVSNKVGILGAKSSIDFYLEVAGN